MAESADARIEHLISIARAAGRRLRGSLHTRRGLPLVDEAKVRQTSREYIRALRACRTAIRAAEKKIGVGKR